MKTCMFIVGFLCPAILFGQQVEVRGQIEDTAASHRLENVLVTFLKEADSTLVTFVRTDKNGNFAKSVPHGSYILLITRPAYADFVTRINTAEHAALDLKLIPLISKARLLEEIIVTQQAIRIKGDTTEYLADSFHVKENATVEDLLKELPGIQVDKDGKITAQGQTVQRVLVDGDEFFSDDPTVATRNLRADAVQKVQVFDKKSDQAEFTGIDDGQRTKTINLELKENAKNGYFGKLSAAGLDRYYNAKAMINAFKAKRKLAAFAIGSSTSETGLDWQNAGNYGFSSGNMQMSAATGGIMISSGSDGNLESGNFSGTGLPESLKGGLHFSNKWHEDQLALSSNYLFNHLKVRGRYDLLSENILENSVYYSHTRSESNSDRLRHGLTGVLDVKLDSTSSIKIEARGHVGVNEYISDYQTENLTGNKSPINAAQRSTQSRDDNGSETVNAFYRKKFKRAGQTLSISLNQSYNEIREKGSLYNESIFFDPGSHEPFRKDTVDQRKISNLLDLAISGTATYTQPLSEHSFLVFEYAYANRKATREKLTYDPTLNHQYEMLNDSLSNKFQYIYHVNSGGLNYRYTRDKINLSFGGKVSNTAFRQYDYFADTAGHTNYINLNPRAEFTYRFSSFRNLRLSYSGYTSQPTIDQVQPVINNMDPLNILIGNPDLKQSFTNDLEVFFTDVKVMTERYIFVGGSASLVNNEINQSYYLDDRGRKISQYLNTDGNYQARLFAMINMKIPKSILRFGIGPLAQLYRYSNFVNQKNSITNSTDLRVRATLQARIPQKFELNFAANPGLHISKSNISEAAGQNYKTLNMTLDGNYQLPWKLELGSDVTADFREKITSFDRNNNIISWNAYIEKRMLKSGALALRFTMYDILDQNKGYSRYQLATGLEEYRYLTWGQYGLISLTWNFVKKGSKGPENMGGGFRF